MRHVESSEVGEPSSRTGVRIFDLVEVGQVENLYESVPTPDQPCSSATLPPRSPGKRQRKRNSTLAPVAAPKWLFEFGDESKILPKKRKVYFDDPNFEIALEKQEQTVMTHRSSRTRHAAPVF